MSALEKTETRSNVQAGVACSTMPHAWLTSLCDRRSRVCHPACGSTSAASSAVPLVKLLCVCLHAGGPGHVHRPVSRAGARAQRCAQGTFCGRCQHCRLSPPGAQGAREWCHWGSGLTTHSAPGNDLLCQVATPPPLSSHPPTPNPALPHILKPTQPQHTPFVPLLPPAAHKTSANPSCMSACTHLLAPMTPCPALSSPSTQAACAKAAIGVLSQLLAAGADPAAWHAAVGPLTTLLSFAVDQRPKVRCAWAPYMRGWGCVHAARPPLDCRPQPCRALTCPLFAPAAVPDGVLFFGTRLMFLAAGRNTVCPPKSRQLGGAAPTVYLISRPAVVVHLAHTSTHPAPPPCSVTGSQARPGRPGGGAGRPAVLPARPEPRQ